ncbi:hypothetical protein [Embleya sp. NPDC020630]|uniref:hypothetical protein n=1 Tax=Embleya sp. NPDC020630 TaxID=3363979 RepID=UPI0037BCC1A7
MNFMMFVFLLLFCRLTAIRPAGYVRNGAARAALRCAVPDGCEVRDRGYSA